MIDKIPGTAQAFEGCDIVVGEIDNEAVMSQEYQMAMAQIMFAPSDSTLDKLLTNEEYALVEEEFNQSLGDLGMKLQYMNNLKPQAIKGLIVAMNMMKDFQNIQDLQDFQELRDMIDLQDLNFGNENGNGLMDRAVQKRAKEMGRPSVALETIEEQMDLLKNVPLTKQAQDLLDVCKNPDLAKSQFAKSLSLFKAYMTQDLAEIHAIMTDPVFVDSGAMDALRINERNLNWIEKLDKMIPEHACFVFVGAGHLPGDLGLLQLLRDRGYTVEPMQ